MKILYENITTDDLTEIIARVDGWRTQGHIDAARAHAEEFVQQRYDADDDVRGEALRSIEVYVASWMGTVSEQGFKRHADERIAKLIEQHRDVSVAR